jgi:hypothetical protein
MRGSSGVCLPLLLCLLASGARVASAEPSSERIRLTEVSLREGLGGRAVLEAIPPDGGRDRRLDRLLELLAGSSDRRIHVRNPGRLSVSDRSRVLFAADESWYLEVMGDGSRSATAATSTIRQRTPRLSGQTGWTSPPWSGLDVRSSPTDSRR